MSSAVLIVEDESDIADALGFMLNQDGYMTIAAADGNRALELFLNKKPDIVLLDLNLPGICGIDLFHRFRRESPDIPIIIMTSRSEESDRIAGLEMGADDYVTKPFSVREVVARVRAVLRRSAASAARSGRTMRAGKLLLDENDLRVEYNGVPVKLTHQEFRLLAALMRYPARVYTRDILIELVYDGSAFVSDRTVDAHIKRIRSKFAAAAPDFDPIETIYGMGYKLKN
jgi:two-component system OmpR family response regulator